MRNLATTMATVAGIDEKWVYNIVKQAGNYAPATRRPPRPLPDQNATAPRGSGPQFGLLLASAPEVTLGIRL